MEIPIDSIYIVIKNNPFVKYLIAIIFAYILFFITKKVVLKTIFKIFEKTSTTLDDVLINKNVFSKLPYLIPLVFLYSLRDLLPIFKIIDRLFLSLIAVIILISLNALINAVNDVYKKTRFHEKLNIKSYIQLENFL